MTEKKSAPLFGIGSVTLLTVLLVLCLTIFAVLALSSAQADLRLSEKNAASVSAYYTADMQAMEMLAEAANLWSAGTAKPTVAQMESLLQPIYDEVYAADGNDGITLFADLRIQENQLLRIEATLHAPGTAERWTIYTWQVSPESDNLIEFEPLPVWTGNFGEEITIQ